MAWNGPPVSVPGLGSQVSSWLTPPASQMTSTRFAARCSSLAAAGWIMPREAEQPQRPAAVPSQEVPPRQRCSGELQA